MVPDVEPLSAKGEALVKAIRRTAAPFKVEVSGQSAQLVDTKASLFGRLPLALAIIAIVTFLVLFLQFGSVVIPIKALILNLLSLTATFGAMVFVFQDGHLSHLLNFTATGQIDATTPILMFCVAFGLSMDYEVFLLSRIKEEHDRTGDNELSVARGLEKTGRIVTAAASADRRRVHVLRHEPHHLHQALRHRPHPRGAHGRLPDPGHARAGVHAPRR